MAINLECMLYLQEKGHLTPERNRILDIGPQNVYHCTEEQIRKLVARQGAVVSNEQVDREAKRLAYFDAASGGTYNPFFGFSDMADIKYHAFNVCPAVKTEILDLNFDTLPPKHREIMMLCSISERPSTCLINGTALPSCMTPLKWGASSIRIAGQRISRSRLLLLYTSFFQGNGRSKRVSINGLSFSPRLAKII